MNLGFVDNSKNPDITVVVTRATVVTPMHKAPDGSQVVNVRDQPIAVIDFYPRAAAVSPLHNP